MYAIRLVGSAWYVSHNNIITFTKKDLNGAKHFRTHKEALTAAMLLSAASPMWIGKIRVHKIKKLSIQKRMVEMSADRKKVLRMWPEQVDHYVTA